MATLSCDIPESLSWALEQRFQATREDTSTFVSRVLLRALSKPVHTLFQVSTSRALVQGVYQEAVSSTRLLGHGDFGLGTFDELDGEMVVLDGIVYQVRSDGTVHHIDGDVGTPFATVLFFSPGEDVQLQSLESFAALCAVCDQHRASQNIFYAFRVDGVFSHVHTRAMHKQQSGVSLKTAAGRQPEFHFNDIEGTLVGFWSPQYVGSVDIPGYHFHFLSKDRTKGGHVLECAGADIRLQIEIVKEFHLSLPDTEEFLQADLTVDLSKDLSAAEGNHSERKS
ncbi:acetolactate decarboxylase [Acidicapsa ligni]|uniref:acetolactate decarboxylase n=1 Tax=Acidicapsa ligni TaxID=542300 RepID=UPI0021E0573D|nr:acetolactate decarboxylase [Acidicapsa ligni]